MEHLTREQLEAGLDEIRRSPKDKGVLNLIVRRPETEKREVLDEGKLDIAQIFLLKHDVNSPIRWHPSPAKIHRSGPATFLHVDASLANLRLGSWLQHISIIRQNYRVTRYELPVICNVPAYTCSLTPVFIRAMYPSATRPARCQP